jgi:Trypsin-co-occurring domain 2
MADYGLGLAESIAALRDELHAAMAKMPQTGLLFRLAPIELTLEVVVTKVGEGKIGWQIVEAGGKYEKGRTQTLKLTLDPAYRDTTGRLMEHPYVSDASRPDQRIGPRDEPDDED